MPVSLPIDWERIASDCASVLRNMPCTCMDKAQAWPALPKEHVDRNCRQCIALTKYDFAVSHINNRRRSGI